MSLLFRFSRRDVRRVIGCTILLSASAFVLLASRYAGVTAEKTAPVFNHPTTSSPIALSADNRLVWVVNSDDDSVSVIRTDLNTLVANIKVGDEPQGVALDPDNKFAYVANAAANTVTVIEIINPDANHFIAKVDNSVGNDGQLITGAEPWNIVTSPDGNRVFVANSGQDTITVIEVDKKDKRQDKDHRQCGPA
jgi:YVTN family beta-propeller protein